jgi:hypothetical protein
VKINKGTATGAAGRRASYFVLDCLTVEMGVVDEGCGAWVTAAFDTRERFIVQRSWTEPEHYQAAPQGEKFLTS